MDTIPEQSSAFTRPSLLFTEFREGLNPTSKAAPAFRVSASLFMSQHGLTAVLVVTALLITAGVKPHPAGGYKSRLLPIAADPGFNRGLSGGQQDQSLARVHHVPAEQPLLLGSSPSTHPVGILKSSLLPLPEEIKASPSGGGHVEWAGSVSSWALQLPCKAPSVQLCLRPGRAVGGDAGGKINNKKKFII